MGISKDKKSALKVLKQLEFECGVSAGIFHNYGPFYQWDYPVMWGETAFIAVLALINVGATLDAERIIKKYLSTIEKQFEATNLLWEKYNVRDGSIMNIEYDAPSFMGWTASTYEIFALEGTNITYKII